MDRLLLPTHGSGLRKLLLAHALGGGGGVEKTVTGPIVTVNDALARNAKSLVVNFAPIQAAGTPAPDNVLPISGWTGVTVYRTGVNLFDKANANVVNGYITGGKIVASTAHKTVYIPCKPNTTYVCSNSANERKYLSYADETPAAGVDVSSVSQSITTGANAKYLCIYCYNGNSDTCTFNDVLNALQIEVGTTPTPYAPYTGTTYPVTFPAVGKNLFDPEANPNMFINTDGTLTAHTGAKTSQKVLVDGIKTFVVSCGDNQTSILCIAGYDASDNLITRTAQNGVRYLAFTTTAEMAYIRAANYSDHPTQLELGSSATAYEPYTNTIYGGYVDLVSGVLVAEYGMVDLGTLNWTAQSASSYQGNYFQTTSLSHLYKPPANDNTAVVNFITSVFVAAAWNASVMESIKAISIGTLVNIVTPSYGSMTAEQFKTAMSGVQLVYELATPVTYQLTLQTIAMLKGTNNVWANTNGDVSLTYLAKK